MGVSVQQWRATIGQWSGGRPGKCVLLQNCIAQTSNHNGYRLIRFLVLISLLVIGCVELNPGPDNTSGPSHTVGALPKFSRRPGSVGLHGERYGIRTAAFLFARALNRAEEFCLASNVEGAGAFDDLVFRYRLTERDVWRTCFIQLKHKKNGGTIQRCSLTQMTGDFSLFKYFESYCQIKIEASVHNNLKQCGNFPDFEFIIYTNGSMESKSAVKGGDADPVSILSSGSNCGQYIIFDETYDTDIFEFFEELSRYHDFVIEMYRMLNGGTFVDREINEIIESFQSSVTSKVILGKLNSLKSMLSNDNVRGLKEELDKCDFSLFKEFLSKVKIFHSQTKGDSLKKLIEKELQGACKTSLSVAESIYTKYEEDFYKWWEKTGNALWLSKNSELWQDVEKYFITEITDISKDEFQEILGCGIHFNLQHIQRLSDAIKQNTFLNIITNSNIPTLHKLKTYQALNVLGYTNSLFIGLKSLMIRRKEIRKLWPCKWSGAMVIDCDCDGNVAETLLDILQKPVDCEKGSDNSEDNTAETLVDILQKYQQKVILILARQYKNLVLHLREKLGNVYTDTCNMSDLDAKSQNQILERTINFQGTNVALKTLVGTDPQEITQHLIDSDVITNLLNGKEKLCVGRKLSDPSKNYVQRSLKHRVYLKNDILKATDNITFAVSGLEEDQLKQYLPAGEEMYEFESIKSNHFRIVAKFCEPGLSAEWKTMKAHHKMGQKIKPEEVRYIILGNLHPESDFRELKALCTNVHWIHFEDGSLFWRESNCSIDIIRRYIDDTKYETYDIKRLMEHNEKTMLVVAEPGMGKSTLLSYMEHEIKKLNPSMWVLRVNLHEHTCAFDSIEFEEECIDKCKRFLWSAARSQAQNVLTLERSIFLQSLEQRGKIVIILDGFDEISPDYSPKVEMLIRGIKEGIASKLWVSSRSSYRLKLEDIMMKFSFTLQPFTRENQVDFLEEYWNSSIGGFKPGSLRRFAEKLLALCSKKFSDKDGKFTEIPLQTMMLGEAFVEEAKNHSSSEGISLPEKFNLLDLFQKFTEKKCDIYFKEKNAMDCSKPKAKRDKESYIEKHMIAALMSLFSPHKFKLNVGNTGSLENTNEFLQRGAAEHFGIITEITDGKPRFIHRLFAEYFAAKWFTENFRNCEVFIVNNLFNSTYESTRSIFDRMLAEESQIHIAVFNNDMRALNEFLKEGKKVNFVDKGGRTALHLAASYNSPLTQTLLSVPGVNVNKTDAVLKWTPLRYAEKTRSWMAMDVLLQNGANTDDIVRISCKIDKWVPAALWECTQKGYKKLLEFILNCGTDVNAFVGVPKNLQEKCTLLHIASLCGQTEIVRFLLERGAEINNRSANNDTALHFAARSGSVDIMKLLLDTGISAILTSTPACGNMETTKTFVEGGAGLNSTNKSGLSPLMMAAYNGKMEAVCYLTERGADINLCSKTNKSALLLAVEGAQLDTIRFLLKEGANINGSNVPWDMRPLVRAILMQNVPVVKHLVESGADLNPCTTDGRRRSALHVAAFVGNLEITDCLIEAGAYLNWRDFKDFTPLVVAITKNKTKLAIHLVEKGANVNIPDFKQRTPLHHSVHRNNLKCTKHLVQFGADINHRGYRNVTPFQMAIKLERIQIVKYLVGIVADVNLLTFGVRRQAALHAAAFVGNVEIADCLIEAGALLNCHDSKGFTPLATAVVENKTELALYLMTKGADVNIPDFKQRTPLHHSVHRNNLKCTKHLVQFGADVNHRGRRNVTPFQIAIKLERIEIVKYLVGIVADVNLLTLGVRRQSALHAAAFVGNVEIADCLITAGALLNCRDSKGFTPLAIAVIKNKIELALYLMKKGADVNIPDIKKRTPFYHAERMKNWKCRKTLLQFGASGM